MPEKGALERTEEPTPERLRKAREEGRVAQSSEVPSALIIASLLVVMSLTAGRLLQWFTRQVYSGLSFSTVGATDSGTFTGLLQARTTECLTVLAPFLFVAAAMSVLGSVVVGGWTFAPKALRLNLSRLSPIAGLKNLLSLRAVVQLLVSVAKLTVILTVTWWYLGGRWDTLLSLQWATPRGMVFVVARLILGLGVRITAALAAIAGVDMLYQRWNHKRQLRMTRQEVREERKQHELSPEMRGRIRSVQMAVSRRRMLQDVPNADVVVTNPTHYAVALRYDAETLDAPQVVAKGADFLCEKIKEVARAHKVTIVEKPDLARVLYTSTDIGQTIPETLFVVVAEVLAMVYRLRQEKRIT